MRKTVAKLLIILMLFSNAAWAMDSDYLSSDHNSSVSEQVSDADFFGEVVSLLQHNDSEDNDHCCHGAAHMIGMTSIKVTPVVKIKDIVQLQVATTLISYRHLPPTPPPTY